MELGVTELIIETEHGNHGTTAPIDKQWVVRQIQTLKSNGTEIKG